MPGSCKIKKKTLLPVSGWLCFEDYESHFERKVSNKTTGSFSKKKIYVKIYVKKIYVTKSSRNLGRVFFVINRKGIITT